MQQNSPNPTDLIPDSEIPFHYVHTTPSQEEIAARCHALEPATHRLLELAEMWHHHGNHIAVTQALSAMEQLVYIPDTFPSMPGIDEIFDIKPQQDPDPDEDTGEHGDGDAKDEELNWYPNAGVTHQKAEASLRKAAKRYQKHLQKANSEPSETQSTADFYLYAATIQANAAALEYHTRQIDSEKSSQHRKSGNQAAADGVSRTLQSCMKELQQISRNRDSHPIGRHQLLVQSIEQGAKALNMDHEHPKNPRALFRVELSQEFIRADEYTTSMAKSLTASLARNEIECAWDISPEALDNCGTPLRPVYIQPTG